LPSAVHSPSSSGSAVSLLSRRSRCTRFRHAARSPPGKSAKRFRRRLTQVREARAAAAGGRAVMTFSSRQSSSSAGERERADRVPPRGGSAEQRSTAQRSSPLPREKGKGRKGECGIEQTPTANTQSLTPPTLNHDLLSPPAGCGLPRHHRPAVRARARAHARGRCVGKEGGKEWAGVKRDASPSVFPRATVILTVVAELLAACARRDSRWRQPRMRERVPTRAVLGTTHGSAGRFPSFPKKKSAPPDQHTHTHTSSRRAPTPRLPRQTRHHAVRAPRERDIWLLRASLPADDDDCHLLWRQDRHPRPRHRR
jgi:hypothetical protein